MSFIKLSELAIEEQPKDKVVFYADPDINLLAAKAEAITLNENGVYEKSNVKTVDGAVFRIAKKQCAIIAVGNEVVDVCSDPGEYLYCDDSKGDKKKNVYFIRTNQVSDCVFSTHMPIVFRSTNADLNVSHGVSINCVGYFSYRIKKPEQFWREACAGKHSQYSRQMLEEVMNSVFFACLSSVFEKLSAEGVGYRDLPKQSEKLTKMMKENLSAAWGNSRGIELKSYSISWVDASAKDEETFRNLCEQVKNIASSKAGKSTNQENIAADELAESLTQVMKELGDTTGKAIGAFQNEFSAMLTEFANALEKGIEEFEAEMNNKTETNEEESSDDEDGGYYSPIGLWKNNELGQVICLDLLFASVSTENGDLWRGDWQWAEKASMDYTVVSKDGSSMGGYQSFEWHPASETPEGEKIEEYLAAVLSESSSEKQFVKFTRIV